MTSNLDRLLSQLNTSGLQQNDIPLYQVIAQLIKKVKELESSLSSLTDNDTTNIITNNDTGSLIIAFPDTDSQYGMVGPPGIAGPTGSTGSTGPQGPITLGPMGLNGEDGLMGMPIPGNIGPTGPTGPSAVWVLVATQVCAGAANYDFTGLSAYNEFIIMLNAVVVSINSPIQLRVSVDDGVSFLTGYYTVNVSGALSVRTSISFVTNLTTTARYGIIHIPIATTVSAYKHAQSWSSENYFITTALSINALRVLVPVGNLSSGTIYVFGR